jgi:hypothetical protein
MDIDWDKIYMPEIVNDSVAYNFGLTVELIIEEMGGQKVNLFDIGGNVRGEAMFPKDKCKFSIVVKNTNPIRRMILDMYNNMNNFGKVLVNANETLVLNRAPYDGKRFYFDAESEYLNNAIAVDVDYVNVSKLICFTEVEIEQDMDIVDANNDKIITLCNVNGKKLTIKFNIDRKIEELVKLICQSMCYEMCTIIVTNKEMDCCETETTNDGIEKDDGGDIFSTPTTMFYICEEEHTVRHYELHKRTDVWIVTKTNGCGGGGCGDYDDVIDDDNYHYDRNFYHNCGFVIDKDYDIVPFELHLV